MSDYDPHYHYVSKPDRSDGQKNRHFRTGNLLLQRLAEEFGFETEFTARDVQDALGTYGSDESAKEQLTELRQSFNNLLRRKLLERNGSNFVISEEGRQLLEALENNNE